MDLAGVPVGELVLLVVALSIGGAVTGLLAGMLSIGGGGILVSILYEVFRSIGVDESVRMHLCVGTALAVIVPTSIRSFSGHLAKGAVDRDVLRLIGPGVAAGVVAGVIIASFVDGSVLKLVFVVSCLILASKLYAGADRWTLGDTLPSVLVTTIYGAMVGLLSTLIGIGGGAYVTGYMTMYRRPIHQAVATAAGVGPIIAIPAAIGFIWAGWDVPDRPWGSLGYVSLLGAALIIPTSVALAPVGVRLAHGASKRTLELAFAGFLTLVALRFFLSLVL